MKDTVLDMDEVRVFYPMDNVLYGTWMEYKRDECKVCVQLDDEFLERYERAKEEFFECNRILEHAYRKQEGMTSLMGCPPEFNTTRLLENPNVKTQP